MKYKIYAGLSGGATYQKTEDYSSMDEALEDAYVLAVEEYQSYEGCHGIMSWDDCRESDELCVRQYLRDVFPQYESILVKISW